MRELFKNLILLIAGGFLYMGIELLFRGRTHWSMFLVGGICFILIGGLNNWYPWKMSVLLQMLISSVLVTAVEFLSGCIINIWLGWNVWDYSNMPLNIKGQICIPFTIIWFFLSFLAIVIDDFLRYIWFHEKIPEYHLLNKEADHGGKNGPGITE